MGEEVNIHFSFSEMEIPLLEEEETTRNWLNEVAFSENRTIKEIHFVFCTDEFLLDLNQRYLNHNTFTDIITFPESYDPIIAEIYISVHRVQENALIHSNGDLKRELHRVMVHGLLHMCKYGDKSTKEKVLMQEKESHYLQFFGPVS